MKELKSKIFGILMSFLLLTGQLLASDPYSFYPTEVNKPKGELFRPTQNLIDRNPVRPLVVTDKNGNKMYTTSDGVVMVSVDNSGNRTFKIGGRKAKQTNAKGEIVKKWERKMGSDMVTVKNEFNEVVGKEKMGQGGKTVALYDAEGNLKTTYQYDEYGKNIVWVVDELTQSKVRYDKTGKAVYDVDAEGNKTGIYNYDADGRLQSKTDMYDNVTTFDSKGNRLETRAKDGHLIATYNYNKDKNGYYELQSVKDEMTKNITLYKDGKQFETINPQGLKVKSYKWQGSKLIFSEDVVAESITWYENGKPTYVTKNGELVQEWMYHEGKMMGLWDEEKYTLKLYSHGQAIMELGLSGQPDKDEILSFYEKYGLSI